MFEYKAITLNGRPVRDVQGHVQMGWCRNHSTEFTVEARCAKRLGPTVCYIFSSARLTTTID